MKKLYLCILTAIIFTQSSYGQWVTSGGTTTTSDNVGIGTTNPQGNLDIFSTINTTTTPLLSIRSDFATPGYYGMIRFGDRTQTTMYQKGAIIYESVAGSARGKFHIALENTDGSGSVSLSDSKFTVLSNGNVGIGITNPNEKLTVNGNLKVILDPLFFPNINVASVVGLGFSGPTGARNWALRGVYQYGNGVGQNSDGGDLDLIKSQDGNTILGTKTDGTSLGNIGIGTTSPTANLEVNTNTVIGAGGDKFNTALTLVKNGDTYGLDNPVLILKHSGNGVNTYGNPGSDLGILQIKGFNTALANKSINSNDNFYVFTNGTVGINTPYVPAGYNLAINGSVIATSVTVQLKSAWPDYVLKPSYHLTPLSEVKTYIDLNHHLPDMPSEQEVADKGLDLGEMNKVLTKKVEELTLYLIEKDKQITEISAEKKDQQVQIDQLKQQINLVIKALNKI